MSSDLAIRIEGLGKSYRISHQEQHVTLAEQALHRIRQPFRRREYETFWALRELDLDVRRGEVLGLVGRNGAGKSTLLKLLSRIAAPSTGQVLLYGRVGSLLEVGTGFHPELTGRENVYLNGAILGMRKSEIDHQFDAIVDFAGVERFLDTPVKRYSSGMYVRLAFAVAAHLDTEILLVDEVLAVGDSDFQEKCLRKIGDLTRGGRTVLLVTHNLDSVQRLCDRALVLDNGRCHMLGPAAEAVDDYAALLRSTARPLAEASSRPGTGEFRVISATAVGEPFCPDEEKIFRFTVARVRGGIGRYFVSTHITDERRRVVAQCDSRLDGLTVDHTDGDREFELRLATPWLVPGRYDLDVFVCNAGIIDACDVACSFEVMPKLPYRGIGGDEATRQNLVLPDFEYSLVGEAPRWSG